MKDKAKAVIGRREFFRKAGIGAGTAAGAAATLTTSGTKTEAAEAKPSGEGYRETALVKKYYDLARF
ncbi:MAG: hypothetical protein ACREDZ_15570 [Kiloniellales bacterium]